MGVSPSVAQKAILHPGDIVFARSGATVGKTYLYDPADGLCAFAGYLIRFRPDPTKALPEFVRWWTHSSLYWRWIKGTMREGAQPNINAREYAKAVLPLPSIEEQKLIVGSIVEVDAKIKAERRCREKLRQLRSGLAADLLTGKIRSVTV
ncbi:MAG: restriction endonuclease subunit S [bacterium]|nr:restriction endonuclease subunit S [bacterium]